MSRRTGNNYSGARWLFSSRSDNRRCIRCQELKPSRQMAGPDYCNSCTQWLDELEEKWRTELDDRGDRLDHEREAAEITRAAWGG